MNSSYYYLYLLKMSWPAVSGLLAVYIFLVLRLIFAWRAFRQGKTLRGSFFFSWRLVLTVAVLAIYTHLFAINYGDWFCRPSFGQGLVKDLKQEIQEGLDQYFLILQNGEELLELGIDQNTYKQLQPDDFVQLSYLPLKKDVVYLKVLTKKVAYGIY